MKEKLSHLKSSGLVLGIVAGILCIAFLSVSLISMLSSAGKGIAEPKSRPDIPADAYWDSNLGMYVREGYQNGSLEIYRLDQKPADAMVGESLESPEAKWLREHEDSEDVIDLAILRSVEGLIAEPASLLSSMSPRDSSAILDAVSALSASDYPELWRRICEEPVFRAQKIVAMERFLGLSFDELGLYDPDAQKMWYEAFMQRKSELLSDSQISVRDVERYGALLLPVLAQKSGGTLSEGEAAALVSLMDLTVQNGWFDETSARGDISFAASGKWTAETQAYISAVEEILASDYEWVD